MTLFSYNDRGEKVRHGGASGKYRKTHDNLWDPVEEESYDGLEGMERRRLEIAPIVHKPTPLLTHLKVWPTVDAHSTMKYEKKPI